MNEEIMRILKVEDVQYPICETSKGKLSWQIRKGSDEKHLLLDSVPLSKETENELIKIIK